MTASLNGHPCAGDSTVPGVPLGKSSPMCLGLATGSDQGRIMVSKGSLPKIDHCLLQNDLKIFVCGANEFIIQL